MTPEKKLEYLTQAGLGFATGIHDSKTQIDIIVVAATQEDLEEFIANHWDETGWLSSEKFRRVQVKGLDGFN